MKHTLGLAVVLAACVSMGSSAEAINDQQIDIPQINVPDVSVPAQPVIAPLSIPDGGSVSVPSAPMVSTPSAPGAVFTPGVRTIVQTTTTSSDGGAMSVAQTSSMSYGQPSAGLGNAIRTMDVQTGDVGYRYSNSVGGIFTGGPTTPATYTGSRINVGSRADESSLGFSGFSAFGSNTEIRIPTVPSGGTRSSGSGSINIPAAPVSTNH